MDLKSLSRVIKIKYAYQGQPLLALNPNYCPYPCSGVPLWIDVPDIDRL